jgi:hypothetical protein
MTVHHKDLCPCGSGKRYKHCHLPIRQAQQRRVVLTIVAVAVLGAGAAFAWTVMSNRPKSSVGSTASEAARPAGGTTTAQPPGAGTGDAGSAFGTVQPGVNGRSPTPAQQGDAYTVPSNNDLAPGETPAPWEYDVAQNRHYDPRPGHGHWHPGPPPKDPNDPGAGAVMNPNISATTSGGTPVNITGSSTVQSAPSTPLAPGENPKPFEYDAKRDLYFDPGHQHWHPGRPPATGGSTTR